MCLEAGKHHIAERSAVFVWCEQRAGWLWFLRAFCSDEEFGPYNIRWQLAIDLQKKHLRPSMMYLKFGGFFLLFLVYSLN